MKNYLTASNVSLIGTFVSSAPVFCEGGGQPTPVSFHNLIQSHFPYSYFTNFILFISAVFSVLFQSRYTSIASDNSEKFVSNTFGHRVDSFFIGAFAIDSCAALRSHQQPQLQSFLRLNSEYVSENEIVIYETNRNSIGYNFFEEINYWSIQFQKSDAGNHDEFYFKRLN